MKKNLKKMDFSYGYDLSGLQNYVDQLNSDIISEAVLSPVTMDYVNVIPGIKGTMNVNLLSEDVTVQTGTSCGFNPQGTVTFTTAPVTVQALKVNQELCLEELNTLWLGQYLNAGSYNEQAPFEQAIIDLQTRQIKKSNELRLWQANTGSTGAFSGSTFPGFQQIFASASYTADGGVKLTGQTALCSVTGSNATEKANAVLQQVDNLINAMSADIYSREDIVIFMSESAFKCYLQSVRNVNNFYIDSAAVGKVGSVYSIFHPQTNYKVVGVPGLNGSNLIVLGAQQYFLVGTDLTSDEDSFRAWWSQDFQTVRIMAAWKLGSAIAFPQFFVTNGLS